MENIDFNPAFIEPPLIVSQMGALRDSDKYCLRTGDTLVGNILVSDDFMAALRAKGLNPEWLAMHGTLDDARDDYHPDLELDDDPGGAHINDTSSPKTWCAREGDRREKSEASYFQAA